MIVREAADSDLPALLDVERRAFGGSVEADLVIALLADPTAKPALSLVGEDAEGRLVGHALFTAAEIEGAKGGIRASLLAPVAVVPEAQRRGIGTAMIRRGLRLLASRGVGLVFVLGHPHYYPRFGFTPAIPRGLLPPYALQADAEDAWMVADIGAGNTSVQGRVRCADALSKPELWRE